MKLERLSGLELGNLVNSRVVSPVEVIQYFSDRIEERNDSINAFVYTRIDEALDEAIKLEERLSKGENCGPFAGVPICLKDFLPSKKGWTNTHGGVSVLETLDTENSRFYDAVSTNGAIAIGKTNSPPFGFSGTCDNKLYGPTNNPFDTSKNSGGSSGGTAAAVADGLVPFGEGGDAGGSIRIPASWCGCYGFKAGIGTIPNISVPDGWAATHPYCVNGAITRTVEDSAAILDYMAQYDPRDPFSLPIQATKSFINLMHKSVKDLKIAVTFGFDLFPTDEEIKDVVYKTAVKLQNEADIECVDFVEFKFKHSLEEFANAWCAGISVDTALDINKWASQGLQLSQYVDSLPPEFPYWTSLAAKLNIHDVRRFNEIRTDILRAHESIFENYDIILAPVTVCPPVLNNENKFTVGPEFWNDVKLNQVIGFTETFLVNFVGYPAASVPAGYTEDNLPIGVQLIGKRYREEDVLALSRVLEQIQPWDYEIPYNRTI